MSTPILTPEQYFQALTKWQKPFHNSYLAMYSSQWQGIVTDPALWSVPVDDHMVHRGDAVFEAFKCVGGLVYCLDDHLDKLVKTVKSLDIKLPSDFARIKDILRDLIAATGESDVFIRLTVSRGSGGFTSNPYECSEGLLILTALRLPVYPAEKFEKGVRAVTSPVAAKNPLVATMKTTSYIQNVLVKKSALDAGADYAVCFDAKGIMTEGSTENISIVTKDLELLAPDLSTILRGSTLSRVMAIAQDMVDEGILRAARHQDITKEQVRNASEMMVHSTTLDCLSVSTWDDITIGEGRQGPISRELLKRLRAEYTNPDSPFVCRL